MGASHDGFLRAIAAEPEEDVHRLVYADWLDEHGEPERAEFTRMQCEEARRVMFDDAHNVLRRRIQDLLTAQGWRWLAADWPEAEPGQPMHGLVFERGFFCRVSMADRGLSAEQLREIARTRPLLALIRWWDLSGNSIGSAGLQALAACPWLGRLEWLDLRRCTCDNDGWKALAASPHLPALARLIVTWPDQPGQADAIRAIFRRHGRGVVLNFE